MPPKHNYCVTRRELLAVLMAIKHFPSYLYGTKLKFRTDHTSLRWLCLRHEPLAQVAHWLESVSAFRYRLEHWASKHHGNAYELMSRQTYCLYCKQCAAIEQKDGGPSQVEIEAELWANDQVVKVQAKDPGARDQSTVRQAVVLIYASLQRVRRVSISWRTAVERDGVERVACEKGTAVHPTWFRTGEAPSD